MKELRPVQVILLGFLITIFAGSILLALPIATQSGQATPYIDALFTATTSVCVTGLIVETTMTHWSIFGQAVIILLVQIGGLGVITITTGMFFMLRKRITLGNRMLIQESMGLNTMTGLVPLVKKILIGTGIIEGIGDNDMIRKHIDYVKKPYEFYGFADDCTYRAEKIREKGGQTLFEFHYGDMKEPITLNVLGKHNVSNALAAIAIGLRYDVPMNAIKAQLSTFSGQRQNIIHVNDYILIDDAYNASPDSMKASLSILSEFKTRGRKIAVLSDMLELGPDSPEYHKEVGRFIATTKVTDLFITGELSRHYIEEAWKENPSLHTRAFSSNGELIAFLETYLKKNDVVLIKGSNGMNLKEVSKALMA